MDGSLPSVVPIPLRSVELEALERTFALEQRLLNLQLRHPHGDWAIKDENNRKWRAALEPFLVDRRYIYPVTRNVVSCSRMCLNEGENYAYGNRFFEASRF